MSRTTMSIPAVAAVFFSLLAAARSEAFHFFRGAEDGMGGSGCTAATGNLGEAPTNVTATVDVFHDSYNETSTQVPLVVRIRAGEQVQWRWTSSHCHSVTSDTGAFDSGFVYPQTPPAGQTKLIPGFFDYPLPDPNPTLTYTKTFDTPGIYPYHCVHHQIIGMEGVVIVDP